MIFKRVKVRQHEKGILFRDKQFDKILDSGIHWLFGWVWNLQVDIFHTMIPQIAHPKLEVIVKSGQLDSHADVYDLADNQVGLIWLDGRIAGIICKGIHAFWKHFYKVEIEILEVTDQEFQHDKLQIICQANMLTEKVYTFVVEDGTEAILKKDGKFHQVLSAGQHLFWRDAGQFSATHVLKQETKLEISGQELISSDKVTLRVNAMTTYKVIDTQKATCDVDDFIQAIYKEGQLVIREIIGSKDIETLLTNKETLSDEMLSSLSKRVKSFGVAIISFGIKDIILPGDMRELMNKVVEAKKTSEANLIVRREETAALRAQLNSAKLLESSPVLMKLKELEVLEKIAGNSDLKVVLGDESLKDKILKII